MEREDTEVDLRWHKDGHARQLVGGLEGPRWHIDVELMGRIVGFWQLESTRAKGAANSRQRRWVTLVLHLQRGQGSYWSTAFSRPISAGAGTCWQSGAFNLVHSQHAMPPRFFTCSIQECARPSVRGTGGCDICDRHLCYTHLSPSFHHCSPVRWFHEMPS
jgi:hypothetical protein